MQYTTTYESPLGRMLMAGDEKGLTGLWFEGQKYYANKLEKDHTEGMLEVFETTKRWLDIYFDEKEPDFMPEIQMTGTPFQMEVWKILQEIPYGKTTTYGEIANIVAKRMGKKSMSAQAVGNAVGHNNISIIIPCHRVIGKNGSLTGYAGGVDKKLELLLLEHFD